MDSQFEENTTTTTASGAPLELAQIKAPVAAGLAAVDLRLVEVGQSAPALFEPLADSLLARGKRLRPLIVLLAAASVGEPPPAAVNLAAAVEEIHLASLIHDDIIDDAEQRRGRPAAHAALGRRKAVLAGDFLAAAAYRDLSSASLPEAAEAFTGALVAMTQAEVLAVSTAGTVPSEADYLEIVNGKTAALFGASAYLGALAAGLPAAEAAALRSYGKLLGTAFQIRDDLLDLYGTAEAVGKPVRRDLTAGLYTLPVIHAAAGPAGAELQRELAQLRETPEDSDLAERISALTREAGGEAYARATMLRYVEQAQAALPAGHTQPLLVALADYAVSRGR
ncbi:MAG TPA: polyprenyl synthetase family protein [Armatimonadota bacterium]